ncbi:MAG: hypothetical protein KA267_04000 [Gemmatimonadales bacterium]|nr:hypothetical protein [Gemmatimonadales bacterium]
MMRPPLIAAVLFAVALPLTAQLPGPPIRRPEVAVDTVRPPLASRQIVARRDALLPKHRIIAYYGNPLSTRMGILGEIPPEQMMARLEETAKRWEAADTSRPVLRALHLIVTVAQAHPGERGLYRLQHGDALIGKVAAWADSRGWLLFLDVQAGRSPIAAEIPRLLPWLRRPNVHLGIDPEFAMPPGKVPGKRIGTLDASDVNQVQALLAKLVDEAGIPPKILVVHRFTEGMLTRERDVTLDPRVQVVIDADGFGAPALKQNIFGLVVTRRPVQFAGLKLFYKNDKPMLTLAQVLAMQPIPLYIQYQ